jgi:Tripartite tricarboxylate transporter family receptor
VALIGIQISLIPAWGIVVDAASRPHASSLCCLLRPGSPPYLVTDVAIPSLTSFSPHIMAKKVRPRTGEARTPAPPDTPTLIEQGVKGFPPYSWWGVYAPAGTPRPIVDRMHAEIAKAVRSCSTVSF